MKKYLPLILVIIILAVVGVVVYKNKFKDFSDKGDGSSNIVLFYGDGCPHCANVDEFIKANKINEKITFATREVYSNQENAELLGEKATACGIPTASVGIPFLWDGDNSKCYVGDVDVIKFFQDKVNL